MNFVLVILALWSVAPSAWAGETPLAEGEAAAARDQGSGPAEQGRPAAELPGGLEAFLDARLLETEGRYSEALNRYAEAVEENPEVAEIRVRYASLLYELGLADTAVSVLKDVKDLDWFGLRTRALAMAQLASQRRELLRPAEEALREVVELRGDDPGTLLSLAQVLHRQGRLTEAEEVVGELLEQRGGNRRLQAYRASLLQELGRRDEAAEAYAECARGPGAVPACSERLVDLLIELGRPAEAGQAILDGAADDDLDRLLRAASLLSNGGEVERALSVVQRVLAREPTSPRARTLEAFLLSALGRPGEAAVRLRELLREDPGNTDLMLSLAWAEASNGGLDEARKVVTDAWLQLRDDPATPAAVSCCMTGARIELAAGRPLRAREWLERVGDPDVGGVDLVRMLATTYRNEAQWRPGIAAMLRLQPEVSGPARSEAVAYEAEFRIRDGEVEAGLRRLAPMLRSDDILDLLLGLQILQATERWDEAARAARNGLDRVPADRNLRFVLAAALERLGRHDEAAEVFSRLLADDPDDAASANYLGYMWADQGVRLDEALELVTRAVELDPNTPAYEDSLGWVHYRLGNLDQAEHWLRRAAAAASGDGTVLAHLGQVLASQGEADEARQLLRRALELGCEDPEQIDALLQELGE